jgi:vitamin B12 transporter
MNRFVKLASLTIIVIFSSSAALKNCCLAAEKETEKEKPVPVVVVTLDEKENGNTVKVVITASRLARPEREIGSASTVITADELQRDQRYSVADALRGKPGLDIVGSGGPGSTTSVFMRGAPSEYTLIMADGVKLSDPMSPGRGYDFTALSALNVDRIEIIRGPQSTLYGSDAISGAINLITPRGDGELSGWAQTEGGSFSTYRNSLWLGEGNSLFHYSVGASQLNSDGISVARQQNGNQETDLYSNRSFAGRFGLTPFEGLELQFFVRYMDSEKALDRWDFMSGDIVDDLDHLSYYEQLIMRGQIDISLFDGTWLQKLAINYNDVDRDETNDQDNAADRLIKSAYNGRNLELEWQHTINMYDINSLVFGFEIDNESGDSEYQSTFFNDSFPEEDEQTYSIFAQDHLRLFDCLFLTAGVRHDEHQRFGTHSTWQGALSLDIAGTGSRLKASYATGFKAPSLFQLYSSYGDRNLSPQESSGWDLGIVQKLGEDLFEISATYFRNDFDEMISYDFLTSKFSNIGEVDTSGVELSANIRLLPVLALRAFYTYTETEDGNSGQELVRRPQDKYSAQLIYSFLQQRGSLSLGLNFVGERTDVGDVKLASYTVANLAASFAISKRLTVLGRVENIFDEDYQEVDGYGIPGTAATVGVRFNF